MHFDIRLEHDGVLLSWAVPRGPSLDPAKKRLAVQTEDHPIDYGEFEGVIPSGYGAGTVMLWDIGTYEWIKESAEDFERSRLRGDIKFRLHGTKISGEFALIHIGERGRQYGGSSDGDKNWLLIKKRDDSVVEGFEAIDIDVSVKTGRSLAQIAAEGGGDPREMRRAARARTTPAVAAPQAAAPSSACAGAAADARHPSGPPVFAGRLALRAEVRRHPRDGQRRRRPGPHHRAARAVTRPRAIPEAQAIRAGIRARQAIVDGELVVLDADGRPSFERMQQRINVSRETDVRRVAAEHPVTFVAFDLLELDGRDLLSTELRIRKKTLRETIVDSPHILFAEHVERDGTSLFEVARRSGIEGIVGKRADSLYRPGIRSPDWVKIKSWLSQSCVIVGYTAGRGRRTNQLGALILAVLDGDRPGPLRPGRHRLRREDPARPQGAPPPPRGEDLPARRHPQDLGTRHLGQTRAGLRGPLRRLDPRRHPPPPRLPQPPPRPTPRDCAARITGRPQTPSRPLAQDAQRSARQPTPTTRSEAATRSVAPPGRSWERAAEVARAPHPRQDPDEIKRHCSALRTLHGNAHWEIAGRRLPLTNLDKVLWPADGITKRDMIEYYVRMAPYMLPYLRDRPLSMQVFPDGIDGKSFWRKDKPTHAPEWIESWTYHGEKTKTYIVVNEVATLAWVANAGVDRSASVALALRRTQRAGLGGVRPRSLRAGDIRGRHRHRQARQGRAGSLRHARRRQDERTDRAADLRAGPSRTGLCGGAPLGGGGGPGHRPGGARTGELGVGGRQADRPDPDRLHAEHHQQDAGSAVLAPARAAALRCRRRSRGRSSTTPSCVPTAGTSQPSPSASRRRAISSRRYCRPTRTSRARR